jgi:hypothetical protein
VPGAAYEYSNFGVGLLGQLLARQSGTSYEALVTTRITAEDLLTFPEANAPFQTDVAGRATTLVWTQSGSTAVYAKIRRPPRSPSTRPTA